MWQEWFTAAVLVLVLALMIHGRLPAAAVVWLGTALMVATGIASPMDALAGFNNPAPITVAAMFVIAAAVFQSGVLKPLLRGALGNQSVGERASIARLSLPVMGMSAFLNNTPVVAIGMPYVVQWCNRQGGQRRCC